MTITIPNILTLIRILLTPLFVIFLLKNLFFFALLIFTIASISDALDGLFARYFNQHTVLGTYLDPIADKLLLASAFVSLAILKIVPGWLAVIVISRDILIVLGVAIFTMNTINFEVKPSTVSKFTTFAQLTTIFLALLNPNLPDFHMIQQSLYWITAGITIISGIHYIYIGLNILQDDSENTNLQQ